MKLIPVVLSLIIVAGCADTTSFYNGNGDRMVTVACLDNQLVAGMTECLKEAEKACPAGYTWNGSTNHPIPLQITEPNTPPVDDWTEFTPETVKNSRIRAMGSYGWSPRIVKNRGAYQYITVTCK